VRNTLIVLQDSVPVEWAYFFPLQSSEMVKLLKYVEMKRIQTKIVIVIVILKFLKNKEK